MAEGAVSFGATLERIRESTGELRWLAFAQLRRRRAIADCNLGIIGEQYSCGLTQSSGQLDCELPARPMQPLSHPYQTLVPGRKQGSVKASRTT